MPAPSQPAVRAHTVRVAAQSSKPGEFAVTADAQGALHPGPKPSPFRLSAASEIAVAEREQRVRITRLTGRIGSHDIPSRSPLTIAAHPDGLRFDGRSADRSGRLSRGSGSRSGEQLALKIEARDLPLKLVELAAPDQRMADARRVVGLSGTVTRPEGRFEAQILRLPAGSRGQIWPPLAMAARGTWGRVGATGARRRAGENRPRPDRRDAAAARPQDNDADRAGQRRHAGRARAAKAASRPGKTCCRSAIDQRRLQDRYPPSAAPWSAPEAGGRVTVADGRYVNFAAGTELRNLGGGTERRFTLKQFAATDAAKGTITGSGFFDLAAPRWISVRSSPASR